MALAAVVVGAEVAGLEVATKKLARVEVAMVAAPDAAAVRAAARWLVGQVSTVGFKMDNYYLAPFLSSTEKTTEIFYFFEKSADTSRPLPQNHVGGPLF